MELIKIELYKIFRQKSVYISLIILIRLTMIEYTFFNAPMNSIVFVSPLITGIMLILGLSSIFTREYKSGVDNYILSSKKGRYELIWAKVGTAVIFTFIIVLTWEIFNLTLTFIKYGNAGWGDPIQSLAPYANSPYELSMLELHLLQIGIHLLGGICLAIMVILISSVSRSSLVTFVISMGIFVGPSLEFVDNMKIPWLLSVLPFAYFNVLLVRPYFVEYNTVKIVGYSIPHSIFASLLMIILSATFIWVLLRIFKNKEVAI